MQDQAAEAMERVVPSRVAARLLHKGPGEFLALVYRLCFSCKTALLLVGAVGLEPTLYGF